MRHRFMSLAGRRSRQTSPLPPRGQGLSAMTPLPPLPWHISARRRRWVAPNGLSRDLAIRDCESTKPLYRASEGALRRLGATDRLKVVTDQHSDPARQLAELRPDATLSRRSARWFGLGADQGEPQLPRLRPPGRNVSCRSTLRAG